MDLTHLLPDEVEEEFLVRGFLERDSVNQSRLQSIITDEESGKRFPPPPRPQMRINSEAKECRQKWYDLVSKLDDFVRTPGSVPEPVLRSRLLHLEQRVKRLAAVGGAESSISLLFKDVLATSKAFKQVSSTGEDAVETLDGAVGNSVLTNLLAVDEAASNNFLDNAVAIPNGQPLTRSAGNTLNISNSIPKTTSVPPTQGRSSLDFGNVPLPAGNNFGQAGNRNIGANWNYVPPQDNYFDYPPLWGNAFNVNNAANQQQPPAVNVAAGRPGFVQQMAKWNLKFSGTSGDTWVNEFLFRVETLARSANIEQDRIPGGMHYILHGDANKWYWVFYRENPNVDWATFTDAMRHQFSSTQTTFEIWDDLRARKQRNNESFSTFSVDIASMAMKLTQPVQEADMVALLRANMKPQLKSALVYHQTPTVRLLSEAAKQFEKLAMETIPLESRRDNRIAPQRLHEIDAVPHHAYGQPLERNREGNAYEDVAAMTRKAASGQSLVTCWNCDDIGHSFQDCTVATRNVFCYGCGAKNIYKPNCQRCSQGNSRQDGQNPFSVRPVQILRKPNQL